MHKHWMAALLAVAISAPAQAALTVSEDASSLRACRDTLCWTLDKQSLRYRLGEANAEPLLQSAAPDGRDPLLNPHYPKDNDVDNGIDRSYPGLPAVSYRPLAYLAGSWQRASALQSWQQTDDDRLQLQLATTDNAGAELRLHFLSGGRLDLVFVPAATGVKAVADALELSASGYFGGGQRFSFFDLSGHRVPLWLSHGPSADGSHYTNEVVAPFFWTPDGWGLWVQGDARGEMNFGQDEEKPGVSNVVIEAAKLQLRYYTGAPKRILSRYTADVGRPMQMPPDWAWRPMVWQDSDTTTASVQALVDGMLERHIPLGAVWLDNPWDAGKGSFDFDPARFADPDALIAEVHAKGVRLMVWMSPFMTGSYADMAAERGWLVSGTRADGNDATYYPPRSIDPHLDFSHPDAQAWWTEQLRGLIARGVDGLKLDRCEEDLSDGSQWANGQANRLNHNGYCGRYHAAAHAAYAAERPSGDYLLIARGGWAGGAQWTAHWAADNGSAAGELGLRPALRSLQSLSNSGFPFNGADIGGYAGTRQDAGEDGPRLGLPTMASYLRWAAMGALSPIMQTAIPPWWISERTATIYQRFAILHDGLLPYTRAAAQQAIADGIPIVRSMAYAYPKDRDARNYPYQYLYGNDLLVSPIVDPALNPEQVSQAVYLPEGQWSDFWTGETHQGPRVVSRDYPLDEIPLFVRQQAALPAAVDHLRQQSIAAHQQR